MHYNSFIELLTAKAKVTVMEEALRVKAEAAGIRMLEINKQLGLLDTRVPKRLEFATDCIHGPYNSKVIQMQYDMDTDHTEYISIPASYVFDGHWEVDYINQQEPKAQLKRNWHEHQSNLLKRFYEYKWKKDADQGNQP